MQNFEKCLNLTDIDIHVQVLKCLVPVQIAALLELAEFRDISIQFLGSCFSKEAVAL